MKDRQAFDALILTAIGLDPKKYLSPIYDGLCELVRERIEVGQQRGKLRKTKARKNGAETQVLQKVLEEILPDGPKRSPAIFSLPLFRRKRELRWFSQRPICTSTPGRSS